MKKELFLIDNLNLEGKAFHRNAVRGIITVDAKILLIYSQVNGDFKFPGGGIEGNETHEEALQREVAEECGLQVESVDNFLGHIIEYDEPQKESFDYFKMDSYYYKCTVKDYNIGNLKLDSYENKLRFFPRWVTITEAINTNKQVMARQKPYPRWTKRDTLFLEYITGLRDIF